MLRFGFRKKISCNHAIFVVKETILNYVRKGSNCKIASLDAEKAFDKVWHAGLIYKLINLKVPLYIIKFIKSFLTDRTFKIRIN